LNTTSEVKLGKFFQNLDVGGSLDEDEATLEIWLHSPFAEPSGFHNSNILRSVARPAVSCQEIVDVAEHIEYAQLFRKLDF